MERVYLETSIWGMVPFGQNPALRQPTLEFLQKCEKRVLLPFISAIVADETRQAPSEVQPTILEQISRVSPILLPLPPQVDILAKRFIDESVLPARRFDDARHVACALVNELDLLVSWNYRHIANVRKAEAFNAVAVLAGLRGGLAIHTPLEVLSWE
jgi:hypothetical protein